MQLSLNLKNIILLLGFFLICPDLILSGHRVNVAEIIIYLLGLHFFYIHKKMYIAASFKPFLIYLWTSLAVLLICALLSLTKLNSEGVYLIRQCIQLIILSSILQTAFNSSTNTEIKRTTILIAFVFALPSIVIFIQATNFLGLKPVFDRIYSPVYFLETMAQRQGYRVTSVFKDSFIASVYLIVSYSLIFNLFLLSSNRIKERLILLASMFLIFSSAFKVGRTALVFIPIMSCIILAINYNTIGLKLTIKYISSLAIIIASSVLFFMLNTDQNTASYEWIIEVLSLSNSSGFSSYNVMHDMNSSVTTYISNHMDLLLTPLNYTPDSYLQPEMYSDNFYLQEIMRYGVYGLLAYLVFITLLLKQNLNSGSKFNLVFIILLAALNYKGGNTFLLAKASLIYPFVIIYSNYFNRAYFHGK